MAWSVLQSNLGALDPGVISQTYLNNVSSGTKLIAYITCGGGSNPEVTAIKDGALNAMTKLVSVFNNADQASGELSIWAMDTPAGDVGTKPTLTATATGGNQSYSLVIQEVSGLLAGNTTAMLDGGAFVTKTGTIAANGSLTANAYSSTAANEFLVFVGADSEASIITWGVPTGSTTYTRDAHAGNASNIFNCVPCYGNSTGGAETASSALTGVSATSAYATVIGAFQLAAGGPPGPQAVPYVGGQASQRRRRILRQRVFAVPQIAAAAVQPVNAPITMRIPQLRRAPALRLAPGAQVPPVIVRPVRMTSPRTRVQPKQRLVIGMTPGKGLSGIPPMSHIRPRLVRLAVRPRGSISGPLAPAVVSVVAPIRAIVLVMPRRGPPRAPLRLVRGERGSLTVPVPRPVVLRCRQVPVPLRVFNRILPGQRGSLTVPIPVPIVLRNRQGIRPVSQRLVRGERGSLTIPIPVPIVLRNRQKIRPVQSRLIPGIVIPPFAYPSQPQPTIKARTQYRLQRQPRQSLTVGMLPGRGLSGIPPTGHIRPRAARLVTRNSGTLRTGQRGSLTVPVPVPIVLRNRQRIRPVPARLTWPFFVSSVVVNPSVSAPTIKVSTRYRLQVQPRMSLRTGMLPGKGLSGIPVQQTRSAPARVQRQPRMSLRTGYPASLTVPVPVPIVLRNRNKVLRANSRLIPSPFAPAGIVYQPVIQQHYLLKPTWRLVRAPKMSLRTGMLSGAGLSGIPPFGHVRPRQAKAVPNVRSRIVAGPFVPVALGARPSSKPFMKSRLMRRDTGRLFTGILAGRGLSGLPPTGHLRPLPPRKLQRRPAERIRTGWPSWGFIAPLPGQVAITHALANTVAIVNSSATVPITNQNVSAIAVANSSATVSLSNNLASSVSIKDSETT